MVGNLIQAQFFDTDSWTFTSSGLVAFTINNPGEVIDFGTVTLREPGIITGTMKDNAGNPLTDVTIIFQNTASTSSSAFRIAAHSDSQGQFEMSGGPNIVYRNMVGHVHIGNTIWKTNIINLPFPEPGDTYNIGNIILTQEE